MAALLQDHWKGKCGSQDPNTKSIKTMGFFCNLQSLLTCTPDRNDQTKFNFRIRAFLHSKKLAVTALPKLLPLSHEFLSLPCHCERCEGGLSRMSSVGTKHVKRNHHLCYHIPKHKIGINARIQDHNLDNTRGKPVNGGQVYRTVILNGHAARQIIVNASVRASHERQKWMYGVKIKG